MINILVTGGAGYIGSHCCKELSNNGYHPITIDNLIYGHKENVKWGEFVEGDIGDLHVLQDCFNRYKIDAVMHFAAFAYVGESVYSPMKYYENNLQNTFTLLKCMLENNIKKIVFSSSCATYGHPLQVPIDETHPQNPITPYGKTKHMIEDVLKDYDRAYNLKFISLRYFNAAGADPECEIGEKHTPETHLIPLLLDVACGKKDAIRILGNDYDTNDGTCIRDYIHVQDLAKAHVYALKKLLNNGQSDSFNLGTNHGYSVMEMVNQVKKVTGKEIPFIVEDRREGDPPVLIAKNDKASKRLKWQPSSSNIENIIKTAWNWHLKHCAKL